MPIHSRASIRYARALVLAAERSGALPSLRAETEALRDLVAGSPDFRAFLADPTIAKQAKLAATDRIFAGKVSPLVERFLRMLAEKYRERMLPEILEATLSLLDEREGKVLAEVRSAVDLSDSQRLRLKSQLERLTGKEVKLSVATEAALHAGFVAKVGDTVYDASLGALLRRIRERFGAAVLREAVGT